jgi:hypothetical protein
MRQFKREFMRRIRTLAVLPMLAVLAGCGEPSKDDVVRAIGQRDISNVSCAAASGKPGYVCTFTYLRDSLTRRLVKDDGGRWIVAD